MSDEAKRWNDYPKTVQMGSKLRENGGHLALFQQFPIRRIWHQGEWWYSIVDCMGPLTASPHPSRYWGDLKKRILAEEHIDVYALGVNVIKLPDTKGRMQSTDCANTETLLRLIQSVRSPNAEPFKAWLARVGAIVMDVGEERTLRARNRAQLDQAERELHELVQFYGVTTAEEHAALDDANYAGLYQVSCELELLRVRHSLPGTLPTTMGSTELAANAFQRAMTAELVQQRDLFGIDPITETAKDVGSEIRGVMQRMGAPLPEDLPQYPPLSPGEWMPVNHPSRIQWDAPTEEVEEKPIPLIEINKSDSD